MTKETPAGVVRLLEAIQKDGEFPAMAQTIDVISSLTSSESTSSEALAQTILQDFGLTQKLLRLVNTLAYSQYGEVTTITRTVLLMGFDRVRSMATSLILFEHFRTRAASPGLADVMNKAFYAAVLGRAIAYDTGFADGEEAFISALYHRLGRILVAFYLPADYATIEAAPEADRERTAFQVLGLSFDAMGLAIAEELRMPELLRQSMTVVTSNNLTRAMTPPERLGCLATLSNTMVDVLTTPGTADTRRDVVERLVASYGKQITMTEKIDTFISRTVTEVNRSASTFKLKLSGTPLAASLAAWGLSDKGVGAHASLSGAVVAGGAPQDGAPQPDSPQMVLTKGLHDVMSLLIADGSLDDVLKVVLETIYRALGVGQTKVLFLVKDPSTPILHFRFGFGQSAAETDLWAKVQIAGVEDVISQAVTTGRDVVVRNARVPAFAQAMPAWLVRTGVLDRFVVVLPLTVAKAPVGLLYIDGDKKAGSILTPTFVSQLKVLRDHAVLSIQQWAGRKA